MNFDFSPYGPWWESCECGRRSREEGGEWRGLIDKRGEQGGAAEEKRRGWCEWDIPRSEEPLTSLQHTELQCVWRNALYPLCLPFTWDMDAMLAIVLLLHLSTMVSSHLFVCVCVSLWMNLDVPACKREGSQRNEEKDEKGRINGKQVKSHVEGKLLENLIYDEIILSHFDFICEVKIWKNSLSSHPMFLQC